MAVTGADDLGGVSSEKCCHFSVYDTSASQLQEWLETGDLKSVDITTAYLDQIEEHNVKGIGLRAVIDTAPRHSALGQARALDEERASKGSRGPLHGIPVLVKDLFDTDPALGMGTTCGSVALRGAKPKKNAAIVDLLLQAGAIVIGKTNLSELANVKAIPPCTGGWSAAGGQGLSPYVRGGIDKDDVFLGHSTPAGSSSGSAAGVAGGFAPISIGSETDGSLVYPATRAGLYGLKASHGTFSLVGSMPFHPAFDCLGLLAKTTQDLATLLGTLLGRSDASSSLEKSWEGLRIGFVDPDIWQMGATEIKPNEDFKRQSFIAMEDAAKIIESAGGQVVKPIELISVEKLATMEGGVDFDVIAFDNWRVNLESYLADFAESPVRTLKEMIDFNEAHAEVCLPSDHPSQRCLEDLLIAKPDPDFEQRLSWLRRESQTGIEGALRNYQLHAILAPGDGRLCAIAAAAGYACGTLPLGFADFNGRGFGMHIITGEGGEQMILRVMSAWEDTFPEGRKAPPMMVDQKY